MLQYYNQYIANGYNMDTLALRLFVIAAELLSSSEGLGKFVWDQFNNGASDSFAKMVVVVFVVGAIGLLLDRMMIVFQRLVSFDGAPTAI